MQKTALSNNKLKHINNYYNTTTRVRAREDFNGDFALITPFDKLPIELNEIDKAQVVWIKVYGAMEQQVNSLGFDVWIKPLIPRGYLGQALVLEANSEAMCDEVNARYSPIISELIKRFSE